MSDLYRPGDTFFGQFTIANAFGAAVNADAVPMGSAYRNNGKDGATAVNIGVPNIQETGLYGFSGTIPVTYQPYDQFSVVVLATVAGTPSRAVVLSERLAPLAGLPSDVQAVRSGTPSPLQGGNLPADVEMWRGGVPQGLVNNVPPVDVESWRAGTPSVLNVGNVPTSGGGTFTGTAIVGGYAAGEDPASLLLLAPANKLLTDGSGNVTATNGGSGGGGGTGTASNYYVTGPLTFSIEGVPDGLPLTFGVGDRRTILAVLRDANGALVPYGQGTVSARLTSGTVALGGDIGASAPYGRQAPFAQFDIGEIQTASPGLRSLSLTQVDGATTETFGPNPAKVFSR